MSTIKFSKDTLTVLSNYTSINSSILFREGNRLKTMSVGQSCIAEYTCEETFPVQFGIYDLNQFLLTLELFDEPVLEINDSQSGIIKGAGRSCKYVFTGPNVKVISAPENDVVFPDTDIEFTIKMEDMAALKKASNVYKYKDLRFTSTVSGVSISILDRENSTGNVFTIDLPGQSVGEYELFMKIDNLAIVPGDYTVSISASRKISRWKQNNNLELTYYIAFEPE